ncbi:hypothetical protein HMPREF0083_04627 [Aneurinibacillus aneurinilyticus ATCC 12856]|uniref:Uncharacterized protein n=1 Tax=Aneurinibacillus aneurinilyticus ATCC 12856 TaxID=649747 RepID=U1WFJ0_ANEAE|nr:hypothetical protein HMPREF0083_04627 [Aneurinibacillus aneurinilyticus ATCC 12856]
MEEGQTVPNGAVALTLADALHYTLQHMKIHRILELLSRKNDKIMQK